MSHPRLELQLDWDVSTVQRGWPTGPDNFYVMHRLANLVSEVAAAAGPGRVLEVAAAEAVHSCKMNLRGMETFVVEPSAIMMEHARARMREFGAHVTLVRGVAETLPFPERTFDCVLIDSAIDHLGQPELSLAEMTRVLRPDGRLIVSFVNYQSLSTRLSRLLYRGGRRLGITSQDAHLFWDTPVPIEHTFECTYDVILKLCEPYLELDHVFGVSLGWMTPGWGPFLKRLPRRRALELLKRLDAFAYRRPRLADFVVGIWRPRQRARVAATAAANSSTVETPIIRPDDVLYPSRARAEAEYWTRTDFEGWIFELLRPWERMSNAAYTGDPARSWLDDLVDRGPFRRAAALGCDEGGLERQWLARGASETLDVYELSPGVIRKVKAGLRMGWQAMHGPSRRVRFIRADLNFVDLPAGAYDVIWSSGCLHHVTNLERLFAQVERALQPGGIFAIRDYVGERRLQFAPERLARVNQVLGEVPARYRRTDAMTAPPLHGLSPFCGMRSDDVIRLAEERFEVVHKAVIGALFPLYLGIDLAAIEREAPDVLRRLQAAEQAALQDPQGRPCAAYLVLRKRA